MARRIPVVSSLLLLIAGFGVAGCTADEYARQADREVGEILREGRERTVGRRREEAARPHHATPSPAAPAVPGEPVASPPSAAPAAPMVEANPPRVIAALDAPQTPPDTTPPISAPAQQPAPAVAPDRAGAAAAAPDPALAAPVAPDPQGAAPAAPDPLGAAPAAPDPTVRVLTLNDALDIAVHSNRDYVSQKETLYLTALSLTATRHSFSPLLAAALQYTFAGGGDVPETHNPGLSMSLSKLLPSGAKVDLSAASSFFDGHGDGFSSAAGIRLTQPLLRGFGRDVAYEALTQAERDLVYAIRDFELFRETFSIDVARRFYDIVQQKQSVENQRRNFQGFVDGRRRAEALFGVVDSVKQLDVLRAKRSELQSQNSLIEVEETLRLAVESFRIFLGIGAGERIDVAEAEPEFVPVDWDIESAVDVARQNRLDLLNRRQQLEDSVRGVNIARDSLRPGLALGLGYDRTDFDTSFAHQRLDRDAYSASLTLDLPLDRLAERNAYRSSRIALDRARRSLDEFEDNLAVDVRRTFRELVRRKQSLDIQTELIEDQQRNVSIAKMRFERGDVSNREVVEAQEALLEALNTRIREKVDYEIARLNLLRNLGILFIDEHGMWNE